MDSDSSVRFELTQDIVRELLDYDPVTGRAFWKKRDAKWFPENHCTSQACADRWNKRWAGKELVKTNVHGYIVATIFYKKYTIHRLVFLYMTGAWPKNYVDHENGNKSDNRWDNLRDLTPAESAKNRGTPSHNSSGHIGVREYPWGWTAFITTIETGRLHLGTFATYEQAVNARLMKQEELGFSAAHGR